MANRSRSRAVRGDNTQVLCAVHTSVTARQDYHRTGLQSEGLQMTVKLEGAALEKRRRAIAANAVFEDRRANDVHDRPMTDHEAGIQEMIFTLLKKLEATSDVKEDGNRITPAHQPVTRPELINVEKLLAEISPEAA